MQLIPLPLADVDWIQIVIVIFFIIGPLLSQLGGGKKPKPQQGRAAQRPPQVPPPGRPPAGGQQAGGQQALQKEIDDFLRQAQARKGGQQQQPRPPRGRQPERRPPRQPEKPPRQGLAAEQDAKRRRARQQALKKKKAQQLKQNQANLRREGVAEHVEAHIKSRPISDHAKQLGKRLAATDENVEEHLHEVFDHKIGELGESTSATTEIRDGTDSQVWENVEERRARTAAAVQIRTADIARMIRDPISMREAIIIGEILKPPRSTE